MFKQGIHGQRGLSCADCHMPYMQQGGIKFTDHHVQSPLAKIDRTCQTCHRQDAEVLRQNVYDRQKKVYDFAVKVNKELATTHLEADSLGRRVQLKTKWLQLLTIFARVNGVGTIL